jgi:alkylation response protein AidB-like acyl-CoA dehydrogenase
LRDKYIPSILSGDKLICLAITEPNAGSDVANIQSRAEKSSCGTYYTLNGLKKWITSGVYSDLFTVCARTGEKGELTLLLVERGAGVTLRKIKTQGMNSSGSTFIIFENVRVPAENVIGKEGRGF